MSESATSNASLGKVAANMSKLLKEIKAKTSAGGPSASGVVAELFDAFPEEMERFAGNGFDKEKEKKLKMSGMSSASGVVAELFEQFPDEMEQLASGEFGQKNPDSKLKEKASGVSTIGSLVSEMFDSFPEEMQHLASGGFEKSISEKQKTKKAADLETAGGVVSELFEQFPGEMERLASGVGGVQTHLGDLEVGEAAKLRVGFEKILQSLGDGEGQALEGEEGVVEFDVYSSKVTRLGRPAQSKDVNNALEEKVAAMKAARDKELVDAGIPARELRVYETSKKSAWKSSGAGFGGKADTELLKLAAESTQAKAQRSQRFQTKAMREYEALNGAKVYTKTLIRVGFPDGLVLEANFSPLEKIIDVEAQIKECLSHAQKNQFYLFMRPKNKRLDSSATLMDLGLLSRASLQLAWEGEQPEGEYLRDSVLDKLDRSKSKPKRKSFFKRSRQ